MFLFIGISTSELLFIGFIAIMLFGANKIPELARTLGKGMRQLRDATNTIKNEINNSSPTNHLDTSVIDDVQKEIHQIKEEVEKPVRQIKRNS